MHESIFPMIDLNPRAYRIDGFSANRQDITSLGLQSNNQIESLKYAARPRRDSCADKSPTCVSWLWIVWTQQHLPNHSKGELVVILRPQTRCCLTDIINDKLAL